MLEEKYVSEEFLLLDSQQNYSGGKVMKSFPVLESLYGLSVTPQFPYLQKT